MKQIHRKGHHCVLEPNPIPRQKIAPASCDLNAPFNIKETMQPAKLNVIAWGK
jgi:hypothetical protein